MSETRIRIGRKYRFAYPIEFISLPDYSAHRDQVVTVIRRMTKIEADQEFEPMYMVIAADGWIGAAHKSELEKISRL